MNAVRLNKESQVYQAEEKKLLAIANLTEKAKRENKIIADFREMLHAKMQEAKERERDKFL